MNDKPVVLITGATSGFGLETAKLLAQRGYQVYAGYRAPKKAGVLRELEKTLPLKSIFLDVTKSASVTKAVEAVLKKEKRIDALVNNAGFVVAGFLEDLSDKDLKDQFDTNVTGLLRVTRAVAPSMRARRSGKIINIGSISGRVVFPGIAAYAASKFAVRSLTEGLRQELSPFGIGVCEIAPGSFATQVVSSTRFGQKVRSPLSPYRPYIAAVEKRVAESFKIAGKPSKVADLILEILEGSRVPPVVIAGNDAKAMNFLKWLLPDAWLEWIFMRFFTWSRFPRSGKEPSTMENRK